jgi:hypothetical protein
MILLVLVILVAHYDTYTPRRFDVSVKSGGDMGSLIMCTLCKVRMLPPCAPDMQVVRRHLKEMGYGFATCLHLHVYTCKYVYVFFMN